MMGLFSSTIDAIRSGLTKTSSSLAQSLHSLRGRTLDAQTIDELEHLLLTADVGVRTTNAIVDDLRDSVNKGELKDKDILELLEQKLIERMQGKDRSLVVAPVKPTVVLVAGVY